MKRTILVVVLAVAREVCKGTLLFGPRTEAPVGIEQFSKVPENWTWQPCPSSLQATPWSDSRGKRTATVLCHLLTREGIADELDTRQTVKHLLERLREEHGLLFRAAFEYEFVVYEKETLKPLGSDSFQLLDVRSTQPDLDLLCELTDVLESAGFPVTSIQPEFNAGQWELNFPPQEGLWAADFAFHVKNAIKIFFARKGYVASFMSYPKLHTAGSGLHMNQSLWTEDGCSAMKDAGQDHSISSLALRWNTGLLRHAPAMTALCCPTVNCYRRLHIGDSYPSHITWSVDNRNSLNRFRTKDENVYLESRLPSGAANPYLVLACHLAAGLSALEQEAPLPPPMDVEHARQLPKSLEEAIQALEKDDVIKDALGHRFVSYYVTAKREYDIKPSEKSFESEEKRMEYEQEKYLEYI